MTESDVKVKWWRYEGPGNERLAGRDFDALQKRLKAKAATAFRCRTDTQVPRVWYVALCGGDEELAQLDPSIRYGVECDAPEPGLTQAVIERHFRLLLDTVVTGKSVGRRRYLAGAEIRRGGRLVPRRPQG